jgi:putative phosphoribosyl transferase
MPAREGDMIEIYFKDRFDAGRQLAEELKKYVRPRDAVILALPRGGVPVGFEVAYSLAAPLDIYLVRKLGVPGQEELAMGAISEGGIRILNDDVMNSIDIPEEKLEAITTREWRLLERRAQLYRGKEEPIKIAGKRVILVDDGLATGSSMKAAVASIRQINPQSITVAVPVGPPSVCADVGLECNEMVCAHTPEMFASVGQYYEDFSQTSDDEVKYLLERARKEIPYSDRD